MPNLSIAEKNNKTQNFVLFDEDKEVLETDDIFLLYEKIKTYFDENKFINFENEKRKVNDKRLGRVNYMNYKIVNDYYSIVEHSFILSEDREKDLEIEHYRIPCNIGKAEEIANHVKNSMAQGDGLIVGFKSIKSNGDNNY
jgi:hypothetical protein